MGQGPLRFWRIRPIAATQYESVMSFLGFWNYGRIAPARTERRWRRGRSKTEDGRIVQGAFRRGSIPPTD